MANIKEISYEDSTEELRAVYDHLLESRGKLANVHTIHSLNPQTLVDHMQMYLTIMFRKSPLKRYQREMMAVVTSATNRCPYCVVHHAEALDFFWKDKDRIDHLVKDYRELNLAPMDRALCGYARQLTKDSASAKVQEKLEQIKDLGGSDRLILDATLVVSYFNYVNRIVNGLQIQLEDDPGGFKYA